jgi:hypothetical protein
MRRAGLTDQEGAALQVGIEHCERALEVLLCLVGVGGVGRDEAEDRVDPHADGKVELVLGKLDPLVHLRRKRGRAS